MTLSAERCALVTKRLQLRSPVASDAAAIAAISNDFDISKWLPSVPFPYTQADASEFIARLKENGTANRVNLREGQIIGMIDHDSELGYWLDPRYWG